MSLVLIILKEVGLVLTQLIQNFLIKIHNFKSANFTAFGMTKKSEHSAENDPMLSSLINSKSSSICLFGKSWDFQVDSSPWNFK